MRISSEDVRNIVTYKNEAPGNTGFEPERTRTMVNRLPDMSLPQFGDRKSGKTLFFTPDGDILELDLNRARRFVERMAWQTEPPLEVVRRFMDHLDNRSAASEQNSYNTGFDPGQSRNYQRNNPGIINSLDFSPVEPKTECKTCSSRRYVDKSSDASVSYQTPTKLNPSTAAMAVASHEREHIVNQRAAAERGDRDIVSQTITINYAVCPECNIMYPSGGVARTMSVNSNDPQMPGIENTLTSKEEEEESA